jgi:hypothetical protein
VMALGTGSEVGNLRCRHRESVRLAVVGIYPH